MWHCELTRKSKKNEGGKNSRLKTEIKKKRNPELIINNQQKNSEKLEKDQEKYTRLREIYFDRSKYTKLQPQQDYKNQQTPKKRKLKIKTK